MNRSFRTTGKYLRRSPYQAIAASLVLTITFFLISVFLLVTAGSAKIIHFFETRPQVIAFLKDETSQEEVSKLKRQIENLSGVKATTFTSKQEALNIYRQQNKDDPLLLEMVTADILPASLEVTAADPSVLSQVASVFRQNAVVEDVVYQQDVIDRLLGWTRSIRIAGSVLVGLLLISSMTTVFVIVSMKITGRRSEIEIIRLLGASRGQVVAPFLLEGIFYGTIGSFIGWGAAYTALLYSTPLILRFFSSIPLLPVPFVFMLMILAGEVFLGSLVGLISSLFAVKRYLR